MASALPRCGPDAHRLFGGLGGFRARGVLGGSTGDRQNVAKSHKNLTISTKMWLKTSLRLLAGGGWRLDLGRGAEPQARVSSVT